MAANDVDRGLAKLLDCRVCSYCRQGAGPRTGGVGLVGVGCARVFPFYHRVLLRSCGSPAFSHTEYIHPP